MTVTEHPTSSAIKKWAPLWRSAGITKNIGRLGITNQKIWELNKAIFETSLVSIHTQVREIMDTNGKAIIRAARIVDLLLTSEAIKMIIPEVTAFTIFSIESIWSPINFPTSLFNR